MGIACAVIFANLGSAYGTAKSGVGICSMGIMKPDLIMKSVLPVIMSGILGIQGLIVSVIIGQSIIAPTDDKPYPYSLQQGQAHLGAGIACGMSSLFAGYAIGIVGDAGVRAHGQNPDIFVGLVLMLIFGEALGLYGLIVALIMVTNAK